MSAEKYFCGRSRMFLFVSEALLLVLYSVLGAVGSCFVVRFNMFCGAVLHGLWCALAMLTYGSVGKMQCGRRRKGQFLWYIFNHVALMAGGSFEQLNLNMQTQSVRLCGW
jgi:hypothetical protein